MPATITSPGTYQVSDLLAVNNTAIMDFGAVDVYQAIQLYLDAYNAMVAEELDFFAERTTDRTRGTGGPTAPQALYVDEFGVVDAQKVTGPSMLGFPLRQSQISTQWTYTYLMNATPREVALRTKTNVISDQQAVHNSIRKAIFTATNVDRIDDLVDNMTIPVKAFANGDGFPIPPSPNALTFDPTTHTHYMASAGSSLVAADVDALLTNVAEHYQGGRLILFVSKDVEATMSAGRYASNPTFPLYAPLVYTNQIIPTNQGVFTKGELVRTEGSNRMTGTYRDAEVWVKHWMPPGTLFCFMQAGQKPLAMRVPKVPGGDNEMRPAGQGGAATGDFGIVYQAEAIPLQCEIMQRKWGVGVQNRICGAVMSVNTSGVYAKPASVV